MFSLLDSLQAIYQHICVSVVDGEENLTKIPISIKILSCSKQHDTVYKLQTTSQNRSECVFATKFTWKLNESDK
jgi:hypothetical protein